MDSTSLATRLSVSMQDGALNEIGAKNPLFSKKGSLNSPLKATNRVNGQPLESHQNFLDDEKNEKKVKVGGGRMVNGVKVVDLDSDNMPDNSENRLGIDKFRNDSRRASNANSQAGAKSVLGLPSGGMNGSKERVSITKGFFKGKSSRRKVANKNLPPILKV